jgi:hypothetical protein
MNKNTQKHRQSTSDEEFERNLKCEHKNNDIPNNRNSHKRRSTMNEEMYREPALMIVEEYDLNEEENLCLSGIELKDLENSVKISAEHLDRIINPLLAAYDTFPTYQKNGEEGLIFNYRCSDNEMVRIFVDMSTEEGQIILNQRIFVEETGEVIQNNIAASPLVIFQVAMNLMRHVV